MIFIETHSERTWIIFVVIINLSDQICDFTVFDVANSRNFSRPGQLFVTRGKGNPKSKKENPKLHVIKYEPRLVLVAIIIDSEFRSGQKSRLNSSYRC